MDYKNKISIDNENDLSLQAFSEADNDKRRYVDYDCSII